MTGVEVVSVRSRGDMKAFIDLPWRLYGQDANWIPPIKADQARLLNPERHPFWKFSERELFLAYRGSQVVGRIAAIVDRNYNQYHNEKMGAWGFFESIRDPEVAVALFSNAEQWVRDKSMDYFRGPLNPSTNYEAGLLIQGFDSPPTFMMAYNPPYYSELVNLSGFKKEKDLFAYLVTGAFQFPDWALPMFERAVSRGEIAIRKANRKKLKQDILLMNRVYNECWANNWGFVPMTDDEIEVTTKHLVHFLDPDLAFFLMHREDVVGLCLIFPDINPLLKRFKGRLGLSALIKKRLYWHEVTGLRGFMFGVKEAYRQTGVSLVALNYIEKTITAKDQYQYMELGWNLEDNDAINRVYEEGGLRPYKCYRIYRKDL